MTLTPTAEGSLHDGWNALLFMLIRPRIEHVDVIADEP